MVAVSTRIVQLLVAVSIICGTAVIAIMSYVQLTDGRTFVLDSTMPMSKIFQQLTFLSNSSSNRSNASEVHVNVHEEPLVVLFWTKYFGQPIENEIPTGLLKCGDVQCFVTSNKTFFGKSRALVFHGRASDLVKGISTAQSFPRSNKQFWIYMNRETPTHTYVTIPDNVFNWSMTYKLDSDIYYPYGEVHIGKHKDGFDKSKNYLEGRTKFVMTVISNCHLAIHRMNLIEKLKKHCDIDIFGKCGSPCIDCFSRINQYKFYLAFENTICTDYLTEKTYRNALDKGIVPVILSGANLSNPIIIPPGSYIDASKFSTALELAEYLKKVGSDPSLYNKFFEWRNHWNIKISDVTTSSCRICQKIHMKSLINKSLPDNMSWFSRSDCKGYKVW
jgi:alpha-1,3-fucosyltransferase